MRHALPGLLYTAFECFILTSLQDVLQDDLALHYGLAVRIPPSGRGSTGAGTVEGIKLSSL
jgi:hypothetical protein